MLYEKLEMTGKRWYARFIMIIFIDVVVHADTHVQKRIFRNPVDIFSTTSNVRHDNHSEETNADRDGSHRENINKAIHDVSNIPKDKRHGNIFRRNRMKHGHDRLVTTKEDINNSTVNQPTFKDAKYTEFILPFRVKKLQIGSKKGIKKMERINGTRRHVIKSRKPKYIPNIETIIAVRRSSPAKTMTEYMYGSFEGGSVPSHSSTHKELAQPYASHPRKRYYLGRDVIPFLPGSSPLMYMPPPRPPVYQPPMGGANMQGVVSDLTRAIDRQQMSGEIQQITNTIAQTMLNTMIFMNDRDRTH